VIAIFDATFIERASNFERSMSAVWRWPADRKVSGCC